jgi:hypothetical protein
MRTKQNNAAPGRGKFGTDIAIRQFVPRQLSAVAVYARYGSALAKARKSLYRCSVL